MGTTVTGTTTTVTGLTPGTQYRFRVRAKNAVGFGPFSQWSTPGTPTGGTTTPPAPALQVSLSWTPPKGGLSGITSYMTAAASADGAMLANVVYTWQGRWLRTLTPAGCDGNSGPCRFTTPASSSWQSIALATGSAVGFHRATATPDVMLNAYYYSGPSGYSAFPSNYWEIRCRVTATRIVDGVASGTSEGFSRVVPFKEYFLAYYDYPTDIITPIP